MSTVTLKNFIIEPTTAAATAIIDMAAGVYDPSLGGFRQLPGTIEINGVLGTGKEVLCGRICYKSTAWFFPLAQYEYCHT